VVSSQSAISPRAVDGLQRKRIGLLTPYSGGNFGDAAIQDAVIMNLRQRIPDAQIIGITFDPADTGRRHGIRSYPIDASSYPVSANIDSDVTDGPPAREVSKRQQSPVVRLGQRVLQRALATLRGWGREGRHIADTVRVLRELDLLIVSGGGQLDEYYQ